MRQGDLSLSDQVSEQVAEPARHGVDLEHAHAIGHGAIVPDSDGLEREADAVAVNLAEALTVKLVCCPVSI